MIGIIEGPSRLWIHRTLESIKDERKLHRILLRLFQNSVPCYAQIRHGPIEYGKDIAVAAQDGGQLVLRMYQAKCGDIKKSDWNGIRPQLEEIFQVPLKSFQIPSEVHRGVGILIWNGHADPHVEPDVYTDIDRTVAAGFQLKGRQWGRPNDTFGFAGVVNSISAAHQAYLNAGGIGIEVGDGMLPHPGLEQIIETYYSYALTSTAKLTFDYQFIVNPAYNSQRGPVNVFAGRFHWQF